MLEESILEHGVLTPLVTWNDGNDEVLIDGYNRYRICTEHGIPFETTVMEFNSREDVIIWIITNQVARRNLAPMQLSYYRRRHYKSEKIIVKNEDGKNQYNKVEDLVSGQNVPKPQNLTTAEKLGAHYRVSDRTIKRDEQVADAIDAIGKESPEAKRKILTGEASIPKKYLKLATREDFDVADLAAKLETGTFERKKPSAEDKPGAEASNAQGQTAEPIARVFTRIWALEAAVSGMEGSLGSGLPKTASKADKAKLKASLKSCIDRLEGLYERV